MPLAPLRQSMVVNLKMKNQFTIMYSTFLSENIQTAVSTYM